MVLSCQHLDKLDIIAEVLDNNFDHVKLREGSTIYTIHKKYSSAIAIFVTRGSLFQKQFISTYLNICRNEKKPE